MTKITFYQKPKIAIYPGSFDPFHAGHIAVLRQATALFDQVLVVVTNNPAKHHHASLSVRVNQIKNRIGHWPQVKVRQNRSLLTAQLARLLHIRFLVRGIRNWSDLTYETQLHSFNQKINPSLITIFFPAEPHYRHLASHLIRQTNPHH